MPDLVVDLEGLDALVSELTTVKRGLANTPDQVDSSRPTIGSGEVCDAMDHFQSHWKDGRKHIGDNVDTMVSMLQESTKAYRKADEDLGAEITQATSTTTTRVGGGPQ